jgi:hypothetical protein
MTPTEQFNSEINKLNEDFKGLGVCFATAPKGFSYHGVYPDSVLKNVQWARAFISLGKVQIGRITYRFIDNVMERYHVKEYKPYDYAYGPEDCVFFHLTHYFATGRLVDNMRVVVNLAHIICTVDYQKKIQWRSEHPKKRKKLQGLSLRHCAQQIIEHLAGLRVFDKFIPFLSTGVFQL